MQSGSKFSIFLIALCAALFVLVTSRRAAQRPHVGVPYTFPELQARAYDLGVVIGEHI